MLLSAAHQSKLNQLLELRKQRATGTVNLVDKNLPFNKYRENILSSIKLNHVTLISAPTGSGKTTQVPQYILDDAVSRNQHCNILVSQPRKIATITIAKRVANERKCELGTEVGYQIGLDKKINVNEEQTCILFCTTGVILQKLIQEKNMHKYTHIILDEVHERDINMDFLMTYIKELHWINSMRTKIILMSATLDEELLNKYFTYGLNVIPGVIKIKTKRDFQIQEIYLDDQQLNLQNDTRLRSPGIKLETYQAAVKIIKNRLSISKNSILVFLPGIYEIEALHSLLRDEPDLDKECLICILHSSLSTKDQRIAFEAANKPKIVLSSNVAESSVTITGPEVDCVIDFCLTKYIDNSDSSTRSALKLAWASHDSLKQRAGRTGRTCDGCVYRMIFRSFYERLPPRTKPEMQRCPLETVVLHVKMLQFAPVEFLRKAISPPNQNAVITAVKILKVLGGLQRIRDDGAYDSHDGEITFIGSIMAALPVDVRIAKFIILSYTFSVLDEAIIIGAGLNVNSIFRNSYRQELNTYVRQLSWADGSSCDFIAILNAYRLWCFTKEQGHFTSWDVEKAWCERFHLERKCLHEMRLLIQEIKSRLESNDLKIDAQVGQLKVSWEEKEKPLILKICVAGAFFPNYFTVGQSTESREIDIYRTLGAKNPLNTFIFQCKEIVNVGEVYEEQLKQKLVDTGICNHINDVDVEFEKGSSKVFVSFPNCQDIDDENYSEDNKFTMSPTSVAGKVSPHIYKAVKLRKIRVQFFVDTLSSKETEKYAVQNGVGKMLSNIMFQSYKHVYKHPELVVIPSTCKNQLRGIVTHVDHIGKFFIQPENAERKLLKLMQDNIEEDEVISPFEDPNQLKRHQRALVFHANQLKRATIVSVKGSKVSCYLNDFGNTIEEDADHVFMVPESIRQFYDIPPQCFEASLYGVEPSIMKCPRGKWTKEAIEKFRDMIAKPKLKVTVFSVYGGLAKVILEFVDININKERKYVNVNKKLIEEGFASECEETYPHKHNHEIRREFQLFPNRAFNVQEEFAQQVDASFKFEVPSPTHGDFVNRIWLHGPTSPLETTVTSILCDESPTSIAIDPTSVNSVLFTDDPGNYYGRLLVSSHVSSNRHEKVLHQTTLFPNVPGIAEIIALIFAPDVSITRNEDKTRFTSLRFGLGAYENGHSFFPEYDCILPVNVLLDVEDMTNINKLRLCLSYLLMTLPQPDMPILTVEMKAKILSDIKSLVKGVFSKSRPVLPPFFASSSRNWEIIVPEDSARAKPFFRDGGTYCQLSHPIIHPYNKPRAKEIRNKLSGLVKLIQVAEFGTTFSSKTTYTCSLCDRHFEETTSVKIHFESKMHKNSLEILMEAEDVHEESN